MQAFIPLAFTRWKRYEEPAGAHRVDDLRTWRCHGCARQRAHIKAYWVSMTAEDCAARPALGADDIDGTSCTRRFITPPARAPAGFGYDELVRLIRERAVPIERDTLYNVVREHPKSACRSRR